MPIPHRTCSPLAFSDNLSEDRVTISKWRHRSRTRRELLPLAVSGKSGLQTQDTADIPLNDKAWEQMTLSGQGQKGPLDC